MGVEAPEGGGDDRGVEATELGSDQGPTKNVESLCGFESDGIIGEVLAEVGAEWLATWVASLCARC